MTSMIDILLGIFIFGLTTTILFGLRNYLLSKTDNRKRGKETDDRYTISAFVGQQVLDWPLLIVLGLTPMLIFFSSNNVFTILPKIIQISLQITYLSLIFLQTGIWSFGIIEYIGSNYFSDPEGELTSFGETFVKIAKVLVVLVLLAYLLSFFDFLVISPILVPIMYIISIGVVILIIGLGISSRVYFENRIAGYILHSRRDLSKGAEIVIEDTAGVIDEIGTQFTKIVVDQENYLIIPNKDFLNHRTLLINKT